VNFEEQFIADDVSEILKHHNEALQRLQRFRETYPYLVAPNVLEMLEHNLKDNVALLYREFQGLQGDKEKRYDKKFVCQNCHEVFLSSLPDGICDKCRAKTE
jgi:hypothetical protein